jgi:hypothetical protein
MNKTRSERLLPGGIPRYIRCYDNKGETFDRYTVVYTGNYNNIGKPTRTQRRASHFYVGMSENPFHPMGFGQHGESDTMIDRPTYSHLGKKIQFTDLPEDCQRLVLSDYVYLWDLKDHPLYREE